MAFRHSVKHAWSPPFTSNAVGRSERAEPSPARVAFDPRVARSASRSSARAAALFARSASTSRITARTRRCSARFAASASNTSSSRTSGAPSARCSGGRAQAGRAPAPYPAGPGPGPGPVGPARFGRDARGTPPSLFPAAAFVASREVWYARSAREPEPAAS